MNNNNKARAQALEHGGTLVLALKFLFATALVGLAVTDKNTGFIKAKPGLVVAEAFVVGIGSAAAFLFIAWNRGAPKGDWLKIGGLAFAVFFAVHFLLELSGFNEVEETAGSKKLGGATSRAKKSIIGKVLVTLVVILLLIFTTCGWDAPFGPQIKGWGPRPDWKIPGWKGFGVEGFVFALTSALPFIMIVKDRVNYHNEEVSDVLKSREALAAEQAALPVGDLNADAATLQAAVARDSEIASALLLTAAPKMNTTGTSEALKEFVKYFLLFGFGHFCLQYGGLYREAGFMGPKV